MSSFYFTSSLIFPGMKMTTLFDGDCSYLANLLWMTTVIFIINMTMETYMSRANILKKVLWLVTITPLIFLIERVHMPIVSR